MLKYIFFSAIILFIIIGCEPTEIPLEANNLLYTTQINLGANYCYQKYYHLDGNNVVGQNLTTDWDLAFDMHNTSVKLNSSKNMRVISFNPTGLLDINDVIESDQWLHDDPSGVQLPAFNNGSVNLSAGYFLVDRGYDCLDSHLGFSIFRLMDFSNSNFLFQIIDIAENGDWIYHESINLQKTDSQYIYFSLDSQTIVDIANFEWDLCFTSYTEFNVGPPIGNNDAILPTYQVVGVLQNNHISVAVDSVNSFNDINMDNIINYNFNNEYNSIGYDWKQYDLSLGVYVIVSPVYIINSSPKNYYKMLFLDFYNSKGEKGTPIFQISKL